MVGEYQQLWQNVEDIKGEIISLNDSIGRNPEEGFKEFKACQWITTLLANHGFEIKKGIAGLETAFQAEYNLPQEGPAIALLCEYDALPGIGHGCGHNMIGAMSTGAAIALSMLQLPAGRIVVLGCPGEENGGGKVNLVEEQAFSDIDVAMLVHPSGKNRCYSTSLALETLRFNFHGKSAHAAGSPDKGRNALAALIQLFNGINALREHLKDDTRIHGIISRGGVKPNVVPAETEALFYFRAREKEYLQEVMTRVKDIARGAALMAGCKVDWASFETANDNLLPSMPLAKLYEKNLRLLEVREIEPPQDGFGSTDMGNVSQVIPVIHPYISIGEELVGHTEEFARATMSEKGHAALLLGQKALAMTGYDLLTKAKVLAEIQEDFQQRNKSMNS